MRSRSGRLAAGLAVLCACATIGPATAGAQVYVERWIATIPTEAQPMSVGIESDGRVVIRFDAGLKPFIPYRPVPRESYTPKEVVAWVAGVRRAMAAADVRSPPLRSFDSGPMLGGTGRRLLYYPVSRDDSLGKFWFQDCSHWGADGGGPANRAVVVALLQALSYAAALSEADSMNHSPAPKDQLFNRHQVSCSAAPLHPIIPRYPSTIPASARRPYVLPVEFVVDTVGRVARGTVRGWPGSDPEFVAAARATLAMTQFHPARRAGSPVNQVVDDVLLFEPRLASKAAADTTPFAITSDSGGWVVVSYRDRESLAIQREWYAPDSVRLWLDTLAAVIREAREPVRPPGEPRHVYATLGGDYYRTQMSIWVGFDVPDSASIHRSWSIRGCGGNWVLDTTTARELMIHGANWEDDTLARLSPVARFDEARLAARARRAKPLDPGSRVRSMTDVACRTRISTDRAPMDAEAARAGTGGEGWSAEVFAGFVVDSSGRVDTTTVRTIRGADSLAVRFLRPMLARWRFRAARRGGFAVPQQTYLPIIFEPGLPVGAAVVAADPGSHGPGAGGAKRTPPVFPRGETPSAYRAYRSGGGSGQTSP